MEKMSIKKLLILLLLIQFKLSGQELSKADKISIAETFEIQSSILNETRRIQIYQPQGLWGMDDELANLPVIYVLDGESQFNHTATTVDFLSIATNGNDFIPRSIVVGIPNTNRVRDLTPKEDMNFEMSGGGPQFLDFITDELIPYIDSTYNTSGHRTIIGHSLGGLMSFEALLRKRKFFDNYISIDPALGFANESFLEEVIDTLNQADLSTENFYFAAANNRPMFLSKDDMLQDTSRLLKSIDIPNHKFITAAESKNWRIKLTTKYYPKENHYSIPHKSTHDGLRELYKFYTFHEMTNYYHPKYKHQNDLVDRIKEHYKLISERMGSEIIPMQGYINSFAFGLDYYNRDDLTIDLLKYNIELHPDNPNMYNNLGYFYKKKGYAKEAIEMYTKSLELKPDNEILQTIKELKKMIEHNEETVH